MTDPDKTQGSDPSGLWTLVRRLVAVAIVLGVAVLIVGSHYVNDWQSCETTTSTGASTAKPAGSERSCKPYAVADAVPLLLVALVFIWPDLSEVELFGIGKVKRRLAEQVRGQEELLRGQQRLEQHVQTLQISSQVASQHQETNIDLGELLGLGRQVLEFQERLRRLEGGEAGAEREDVLGPSGSSLEETWAKLAPFATTASRLNDDTFVAALREGIGAGRPPEQAAGLTPRDRDLLRRVSRENQLDLDALIDWKDEFRLQLESIRRAMRSADRLSTQERADASTIAEALLRELRQRSLID